MNITVSRLHEMLKKSERVQVLDVRSPGEFAAGHVPGAVNLPMDEVEARLGDIRPGQQVVLICLSGERSQMTCDLLKRDFPEAAFVE